MSLKRKIPMSALVVVALLVGAGVAAAAITITNVDPNSVEAGQGQVQQSTNLTINDQQLTYAGVDVSGVNVTVDNAGTVQHTADVHLALKKSDGTIVATKTVTGQTLAASSATTVSVTLATAQSVDSFSSVEVVVEETA